MESHDLCGPTRSGDRRTVPLSPLALRRLSRSTDAAAAPIGRAVAISARAVVRDRWSAGVNGGGGGARVVVSAKYGYLGATSTSVSITR
jgi:hypothetical protein